MLYPASTYSTSPVIALASGENKKLAVGNNPPAKVRGIILPPKSRAHFANEARLAALPIALFQKYAQLRHSRTDVPLFGGPQISDPA